MPTPFFDFTVAISKDPALLDRFVENQNIPEANELSDTQKRALLSGEFSQIKPLLVHEDSNVALKAEALPGALVGWNMFQIQGNILLARDRQRRKGLS